MSNNCFFERNFMHRNDYSSQIFGSLDRMWSSNDNNFLTVEESVSMLQNEAVEIKITEKQQAKPVMVLTSCTGKCNSLLSKPCFTCSHKDKNLALDLLMGKGKFLPTRYVNLTIKNLLKAVEFFSLSSHPHHLSLVDSLKKEISDIVFFHKAVTERGKTKPSSSIGENFCQKLKENSQTISDVINIPINCESQILDVGHTDLPSKVDDAHCSNKVNVVIETFEENDKSICDEYPSDDVGYIIHPNSVDQMTSISDFEGFQFGDRAGYLPMIDPVIEIPNDYDHLFLMEDVSQSLFKDSAPSMQIQTHENEDVLADSSPYALDSSSSIDQTVCEKLYTSNSIQTTTENIYSSNISASINMFLKILSQVRRFDNFPECMMSAILNKSKDLLLLCKDNALITWLLHNISSFAHISLKGCIARGYYLLKIKSSKNKIIVPISDCLLPTLSMSLWISSKNDYELKHSMPKLGPKPLELEFSQAISQVKLASNEVTKGKSKDKKREIFESKNSRLSQQGACSNETTLSGSKYRETRIARSNYKILRVLCKKIDANIDTLVNKSVVNNKPSKNVKKRKSKDNKLHKSLYMCKTAVVVLHDYVKENIKKKKKLRLDSRVTAPKIESPRNMQTIFPEWQSTLVKPGSLILKHIDVAAPEKEEEYSTKAIKNCAKSIHSNIECEAVKMNSFINCSHKNDNRNDVIEELYHSENSDVISIHAESPSDLEEPDGSRICTARRKLSFHNGNSQKYNIPTLTAPIKTEEAVPYLDDSQRPPIPPEEKLITTAEKDLQFCQTQYAKPFLRKGFCFSYFHENKCFNSLCKYIHVMPQESLITFLGQLILHFLFLGCEKKAWNSIATHYKFIIKIRKVQSLVSIFKPLARVLVQMEDSNNFKVPNYVEEYFALAKMEAFCEVRKSEDISHLLLKALSRPSCQELKEEFYFVFIRYFETFVESGTLTPWEVVLQHKYLPARQRALFQEEFCYFWILFHLKSDHVDKVVTVYRRVMNLLPSVQITLFKDMTLQYIHHMGNNDRHENIVEILKHLDRLRAFDPQILFEIFCSIKVLDDRSCCREYLNLVVREGITFSAYECRLIAEFALRIDLILAMKVVALFTRTNNYQPSVKQLQNILCAMDAHSEEAWKLTYSVIRFLLPETLQGISFRLQDLISRSPHFPIIDSISYECFCHGIDIFINTPKMNQVTGKIGLLPTPSKIVRTRNQISALNKCHPSKAMQGTKVFINAEDVCQAHYSSNYSTGSSENYSEKDEIVQNALVFDSSSHNMNPAVVLDNTVTGHHHNDNSIDNYSTFSGSPSSSISKMSTRTDQVRHFFTPDIWHRKEFEAHSRKCSPPPILSPALSKDSHAGGVHGKRKYIETQDDDSRRSANVASHIRKPPPRPHSAEMMDNASNAIPICVNSLSETFNRDQNLHDRSSDSSTAVEFEEYEIYSSPESGELIESKLFSYLQREQYPFIANELERLITLNSDTTLEKERLVDVVQAFLQDSILNYAGKHFSSLLRSFKELMGYNQSNVHFSSREEEIFGRLGSSILIACAERKVYDEAAATVLSLQSNGIRFHRFPPVQEEVSSCQTISITAIRMLYLAGKFANISALLKDIYWSGGVEDVQNRLRILKIVCCKMLKCKLGLPIEEIIEILSDILSSLAKNYFHDASVLSHKTYSENIDLGDHIIQSWRLAESFSDGKHLGVMVPLIESVASVAKYVYLPPEIIYHPLVLQKKETSSKRAMSAIGDGKTYHFHPKYKKIKTGASRPFLKKEF